MNELGGATRHPEHLTEEQVAQRVRQQVEASLDPGGPILQLSDETYFLDPEGHWVVSAQSTRCSTCRGRSPCPAWSAGALRSAGSARASSAVAQQDVVVGPLSDEGLVVVEVLAGRASPGAAVRGLRDLLSLSRPTCHSFLRAQFFLPGRAFSPGILARMAGENYTVFDMLC